MKALVMHAQSLAGTRTFSPTDYNGTTCRLWLVYMEMTCAVAVTCWEPVNRQGTPQ